MQYQDLSAPKSGVYPLSYPSLTIPSSFRNKSFPQPVSSFPFIILLSFLISNALKLYIPFAIQNFYLSISPTNFAYPTLTFIVIILASYYIEIKASGELEKYKIQVKSVLSERVMRATLRAPFEQLENKENASRRSSWCKISENVNIYANNYYVSYLTIIFETSKALFIVFYLFFKIGRVTLIGLAIGGMIVQFLQLISKKIENINFLKLRLMELKTKILTEYFTRIVDYQMSWLDGFIADRIENLQNQYQKNLRKVKLLDAWCVGLWQFTQIGISSVVLCLYYFYNENDTAAVQPATIIYLFQMLTFPMNAISWNVAGLNNAERAIKQLSQSQRNIEAEKKKQKAIQKFDYGEEIKKIQSQLQPARIYALADTLSLRKLALSLSKKGQKLGFVQQNSFQMQSFMETIFLLPQQYLSSSSIKQSKQELTKILQICKCSQVPLENPVTTYSGGEKMRVLIARAFFNGKTVVIDSELMSLDKNTRTTVYTGIREFVQKQGITVVLRGRKGDADLDANVHQFIKIGEFSRVKFEANQLIKPISKKTVDEEREIQKQKKQIEQKLNEQISRLQTIQIFHPSIDFQNRSSILSEQSQEQLLPSSPTCANSQAQSTSFEQQKGLSFRPVSSESSNFLRHSKVQRKSKFKPLTRKLKLSFSTLNFYYGHKIYHILFVLALVAMYAVGNYYNYFVNLMKVCDASQVDESCSASHYAYIILYITLLYVLCIILRSYLFAVANLKESERICHLTNKMLVYNHISFYSKQHIIDPTPQQPPLAQKVEKSSSSSQSSAGQQSEPFSPPSNQPTQQSEQTVNGIEKLVYLCTSDSKNVNNGYPFDTNILWNNIATVASCIIVVAFEVPLVLLLILGFVVALRKIQNDYRVRNQGLVLLCKDQEIELMKSINYIEGAGINLHVYKKVPQFIYKFKQNLQSVHSTNIQQSSLSIWMQINFRIYMLIFLCVCILLFWAKDLIFGNTDSDTVRRSAEMSVMVRYVLLLADYVFYLVRSWADSRGKAISIERIRRCVENVGVIKGSFERLKRSNRKKQSFLRYLKQNEGPFNKPFINLSNFSFQYDKRTPNVLENINLDIRPSDKIVLKGKTGSGKTSLFKILMGLYPESYFPQSSIHLLSFSSQYPLNMGQCSLLEKLDPYRILEIVPVTIKDKVMKKAQKIFDKYQKNKNQVSFQDQVMINNLRAYLYGFKGLVIYDEPQFVYEQSGTYIIVTHHGKFKNNLNLMLDKGTIVQVADTDKSKSKSKQKRQSPLKGREDSKTKTKKK